MGQTLRDLFKSRKGEVYGSTGNQIFIETQGVVNVPRQAALLASSPSGLNQLIGNQIGGLFKGSANRPSDTIYPSNSPIAKPVSLIPGALTGVRDAVEGGEDKRYFINKKPSGNSLVGQLRSGTKPTALIGGAAVNALKNPFRAAKGIADMLKGLQDKENSRAEYGTKYSEVQSAGDPDSKIITTDDVTYKTHFRQYVRQPDGKFSRGDLYPRQNTTFVGDVRPFSQIVYEIQTNKSGWQDKNKYINVPYVGIRLYDRDEEFFFPATVTGLNENFTPEVTSFRYVGSPFNLYGYKGIERSLQFSFKLYFTDHATKLSMIRTLNKLRTLVFPNPNLAGITYANTNSSALLAIKPNLIYLTISGVYENMMGIVDSFGISIEDSVPWVTTVPDSEQFNNGMQGEAVGEKPYPSVINCTFGMKIIESPNVRVDAETTKKTDSTGKEVDIQKVTGGEFEYKNTDTTYFTGVGIVGDRTRTRN